MSEAWRVTRGFWIGLGIAAVLCALSWGANNNNSVEKLCIEKNGLYKADNEDNFAYCHLPEVKQ